MKYTTLREGKGGEGRGREGKGGEGRGREEFAARRGVSLKHTRVQVVAKERGGVRGVVYIRGSSDRGRGLHTRVVRGRG